MVLNQSQAEAVYGAMCALNNVGATIEKIEAKEFDVSVRENVITIRSSSDDFSVPVRREVHNNQAAFAHAYALK